MSHDAITIAGAGLSGMAAALTLANAGREVVVHEKGAVCGAQRHNDVEGLETWIFPQDPLDYLQSQGLPTSFDHHPARTFHFIDHRGQVHSTTAQRPYFYLLRRGAEPGSMDRTFQLAAEAAGVQLRFGSKRSAAEVDIFAGGPRRAKAYVEGLTFSTPAPDGVYLLLGGTVAPAGYAYCIIWSGRGTIASAYRVGAASSGDVLSEAVTRFRDVLGLSMEDPVKFGSFGSYAPRPTSMESGALLVGEAAGFQDALFGFGMNYAIRSGVLAARALIHGDQYAALARKELVGRMASSWVNRGWYERLGAAPRSLLAARLMSSGTAWAVLHRVSRPSLGKRLVSGWSHLRGRR